MKENYTLAFNGKDTLTEFDLYKGFSLNQLLTILSTKLGEITKITGVEIIQTKGADLYTPKSFITDTYLKAGGTANTTNYIGSEEFPKIMYFPPEYDYYN
ncbi:MAG TPA: hypothetical protein EYO59_12675 [Chromatiaceae bacterium]|nr:hypothetical protein [Chromatiaceae bacterium]